MQDRRTPLNLFVGRAAELARGAEVIARVKQGEPWLVAVEGDPGVGKTTLARHVLAGPDGLKVLSARADAAEADLDFGIVEQLLRADRAATGRGPARWAARPRRSRSGPGCWRWWASSRPTRWPS